jgi:hypothetical protein
MTASHYADPRQRADLPVANLFSEIGKHESTEKNEQETSSTTESQSGTRVRNAH